MVIVNIHEAKTHFSKLIQQVVNGEEIIVAKSGVPLIKMIPYEKSSTSRKGGQLKGMMLVKDNFDEPLPREYLKSFYGEEPS